MYNINVARDQRDTTVGTLARIKSCFWFCCGRSGVESGGSVGRRDRVPREEGRPSAAAAPRRDAASIAAAAADRAERLARGGRAPQCVAASAAAETLHGFGVAVAATAAAAASAHGEVVGFRCPSA